MHAGDDGAVVLAHEDRQQAPIVDAAGGRVELVEALVEQRHVLAARLVLDLQLVAHWCGRAVTSRTPRRPRARALEWYPSSARRSPRPSPARRSSPSRSCPAA